VGSVPHAHRRHDFELAAEEQDPGSEVVEGSEAASVGLECLNDRVEALGGGVGDVVPGVVDQSVVVPAQHQGHLLDRLDSAAHGSGTPGIEEALCGLGQAVVPEGGKALLQGPGPAGLQIGLEQAAKLQRPRTAFVFEAPEPGVLGACQPGENSGLLDGGAPYSNDDASLRGALQGFRPYAETMGSVFQTGLEYYTVAMTVMVPEIMASTRVVQAMVVVSGVEKIANAAPGRQIMDSSLSAVDRLPRFKVLTEQAVNEIKAIIRSGLGHE